MTVAMSDLASQRKWCSTSSEMKFAFPLTGRRRSSAEESLMFR